MKGQPFSVRLEEETEKLVDAEARRTRRSKSAVVEVFTEEAARARRFPGIAFRGDAARRRPWVIGPGLDVWEDLQMVEEFSSVETLVAETQLTPPQVRLALAYRQAYPEEVEQAIADNRRPLDELRTLFPFIEVVDA
ncbi:MAG: ribbon-helix-helix protein, CopG family [Actinobacteria bacterium]|nr:ribbon-helix-helix protein, CopG family [Actinomycetota bacterium]